MSKPIKSNVLHGEFAVPYECDMDRGYGVEGTSDTLFLVFEDGELIDAKLQGMHFITEYEFEDDYNITTDIAIQILKDKGLIPENYEVGL